MKKTAAILLPLLLVTTLVYLPILLNPDLLLERGNDLQEFFWPIFHFVKDQIINHKIFPLWNNLFLSGTPLLPDPQAPLFYLPNIIFLVFPIDVGFIASFFLHTLIGGIGAYLAARYAFKFSRSASFLVTALYITAPRLAGYLEAGHFGLVATTAWLPFVLLATIKLADKPKFSWSVVLALSLSGLFYTHVPTFVFAALISSLLFVFLTLFIKAKKNRFNSFLHFGAGAIVTFGLTAVTLLPQLEWMSETTRYTLLNDRDVYPKWTSLEEFAKAIFVPWINGKESFWQFDTEKGLAIGIITISMVFIGFRKLKRVLKIPILLLAVFVLILALNNISPFYPLLLSQDWYVLARVSTRIWFVITVMAVFLAGYGFDKLRASKTNIKLLNIFSLLAVVELIFVFWLRLLKPVPQQSNSAPKQVYEFLSKDVNRFRVFCTTRCLSQKEAAKYEIELVEGYSTLQQKNYYQHAWQLTGAYWDYYTLAIPPFGSYKFEKLQPDATSLGDYNTKYVISPHELENENFVLEEEIDNYLVYRNTLVKPRANAPISIYTPNHIRVDTSDFSEKQLILSEVYNPGWKAYLNGEEKIAVQETPIALRAVDIKPNTRFVDFKYQPESYKWGRIITFATIALLLGWGIKEWKKS